MAQIKEQIKTPKTDLSDEEIANLSDTEFKTLVIRMLTELVEFGHKLDEKMKAMLRETKENVQGTSSDRKKTGKEKSSYPFHQERTIFRGTAVVWMQVDFLHGDKFFQHFYLHILRQLGALVLSAEPALGT